MAERQQAGGGDATGRRRDGRRPDSAARATPTPPRSNGAVGCAGERLEAKGAAAARARRRLLPRMRQARVWTAGGVASAGATPSNSSIGSRRAAARHARARRAPSSPRRRHVARRHRALGRRIPADRRAVRLLGCPRCRRPAPAARRPPPGKWRSTAAPPRVYDDASARLRTRHPSPARRHGPRQRRRRHLGERQVAALYRRRPLVAGAQPMKAPGLVALLQECAEDEAAGVRLGQQEEDNSTGDLTTTTGA